MSTVVEKTTVGQRDLSLATTKKDNKIVSQRYVIPTNISAIKDCHVAGTSLHRITVEEHIRKTHTNEDLEISFEPSEWFKLSSINIFLKGSGDRLLSNLMPIDNKLYPQFSMSSAIVFDSRFELESDRRNLKTDVPQSYHDELDSFYLNSLILQEMLIRHLDFVKDLGSDKNFQLMFVDPCYNVFNFIEHKTEYRIRARQEELIYNVENFYSNISNKFIEAMINANGDKIHPNSTPMRIPFGARVVEWCNKNITLENRKQLFSKVPSNDKHEFISENESIAVSKLKELPYLEFIDNLLKCGKLTDFQKWVNSEESMEWARRVLPLPEGYDFVILHENDLEGDLSEILTKLGDARKTFRVFNNKDEQYNEFEQLDGREDIFIVDQSNHSTQDLFDFILTNIVFIFNASLIFKPYKGIL